MSLKIKAGTKYWTKNRQIAFITGTNESGTKWIGTIEGGELCYWSRDGLGQFTELNLVEEYLTEVHFTIQLWKPRHGNIYVTMKGEPNSKGGKVIAEKQFLIKEGDGYE